MHAAFGSSHATTLASLRRLLLGVLAFGLAGTTTDLLLISHYEDSWQVVPLATLACAFVATAVVALTTSAAGLARVLPLFRTVMVAMVLVGMIGAVLHYRANMEFKLEMDPTLSGFALFSSVVRAKAPPAMAPGTLVLLGFLGLALAYRRADDLGAGTHRLSQEELMNRAFVFLSALTLAIVTLVGVPLSAQVGKGLLDINSAPEKELMALPHMTPAIVKGLIDKRPFATIVDANAFLASQGLTPAQAEEVYRKAFVHVNLNTGTSEEIILIPGAGKRMVREFAEYRPWKVWAQFDKEISRYVGQPETDRLKQYVFIPVNLNTATDEDILSIPGAGARMVREFKEYRPWKTKEQFEKEIGKYVGAKEVARLWRYVVIQ